MGYDLVTWAPIKAGGNGWDITGATQLDGSVNAGAPTRIDIGDSSGFSSTPTIAQINASTGINQVIGAYNRRAKTYNAAFGTSLAILSYLNSSARESAGDFTNILAKINALRADEGWTGGNLVWPNSTPTSGLPPRGDHLAFLRKALTISGTIKMAFAGNFRDFNSMGAAPGPGGVSGSMGIYSRADFPYNTHINETDGILYSGDNATLRCGKICPNASNLYRYRQIFTCCIPEWLTTNPATSKFNVNVQTLVTTLENIKFILYNGTNADFPASLTPAYAGTAYDRHQDQFNNFLAVGNNLMTLTTPSELTRLAGGYITFMLAQSNELNNIGAGISSTLHNYIQLTTGAADHYLQLTF